MRTTRTDKNASSRDRRRFPRLRALLHRCRETYRNVREALADVRALRARRRGAGDGTTAGDATTAGADAPAGELASLTERSQALVALCDRLLQELDATDVGAAEVRFFVHKQQPASYPRVDAQAAADLPGNELMWELRRLIAWAAGTLADVAGTIEARSGDLDERGRELLQDEVTALDVDLGLLKTQLLDPVDWDAELGHLLAGEVAPFDDPAADDDDDADD